MEPTYDADRLFKPYNRTAYHLAQKIERGQPITESEVKDVPGGVNARYGDEITLLFLALSAHNVQAIDVLLDAGADPYMIDRPSTGSKRDFVYYLTLPGHPFDPSLGFPFINQLITLYLKHGGDPNRRLQGSEREPLIEGVALIENYDGMNILLKAGADPWAMDERGGSAMDKLCLSSQDEDFKQINSLIDRGYFDHPPLEALKSFMSYLSGYKPRGDEITRQNQKIGLRVLKRNPNYLPDRHTERLFEGPIPWDKVKQAE